MLPFLAPYNSTKVLNPPFKSRFNCLPIVPYSPPTSKPTETLPFAGAASLCYVPLIEIQNFIVSEEDIAYISELRRVRPHEANELESSPHPPGFSFVICIRHIVCSSIDQLGIVHMSILSLPGLSVKRKAENQ